MAEKVKRIIFIIIEAVIYATFVFSDFSSKDSTPIKYAGIVLCLIYAVLSLKNGKDHVFLCVAFVFTLVADWFLLVKNSDYVFGVAAFIVAQTVYFLRLVSLGVNVKRTIIDRLVVTIAAIAVLFAANLADWLTVLVAIYFVALVANCVDSYALFKNGVKNKLFAIGLTLFILCDVSVGLNNFSAYFDVSAIKWLIKAATYLMWIFYLPSQVLIDLSGGAERLTE